MISGSLNPEGRSEAPVMAVKGAIVVNPSRILVTFGLLLFLTAPARAQVRPADPMDAAEIQIGLERLRVLGTALYVAAHPDDENTAFLTYLTQGRQVRAGYLSLTRGDGGQNLIGSETGIELGMIRSQELLAARRIDGAEQFFTRALDFGYSKRADETMEIWGREAILSDLVWTIRQFRPDVIITRFPTDSTAGHGHHQASAILAEEAFRAAADTTRFFEQLAHVRPWQAKRIVWNAFRFDPTRDPSPAPYVSVDLGEYNRLLGRAYTEIAAESRSMHKSQGFGASERRGQVPNYFVHKDGATATHDLFDGVDVRWTRIPGGDRVDKILVEAQKKYRADEPGKIIPILLKAHAAMKDLEAKPNADPLIAVKRHELEELIASSAGLWLEAIAESPVSVPGGEVKVRVSALNRSTVPLKLERVELPYGAKAMDPETPPGGPTADASGATLVERKEVTARDLTDNRPVLGDAVIPLPRDQRDTQPYWLRREPLPGRFDVGDFAMLGRPDNPPALQARFVLSTGGQELAFDRPIVHRWTDPVQGERYRPLEISPPVGVRLEKPVYLFPTRDPVEVVVVAQSGAQPMSGSLSLELPEGWRATPTAKNLELAANGEASTRFTVYPPDAGLRGGGAATVGSVTAVFESGGKQYSRDIERIDYSHIPIQSNFPPARAKLVRADVQHLGAEIGYVMGSGDEVGDALRQMGYRVSLLEDDDIGSGNLSRFDAIVIGVRAYNTRQRLRALQPRLIEYVNAGGTLVVQYQTADRGLDGKLGPLPFTISRNRVSVESAEVRFPSAQHPLLVRPNLITADDFVGWVQERGLYFASPYDQGYDAVLSANDPGEPPRDGGLIYARHGKGIFIYTGYSWFRQLPAGVPGAYRLFANLVSAGR
jgi:LmbE family N-acetylglucosaminyl deacetylase